MRISLRQVNNGLLAAIIIVNGYIIAAPLYPKVAYWWQKSHTRTQQQLSQTLRKTPAAPQKPASLGPNQLIAPSMLLQTPIQDGPVSQTYRILDKGIWRWPLGSTPDKGGNTILIGHRFTYTNPRGIFYNLDKLHMGDDIGVIWNNKKYVYKVTGTKVVPPSDTSILNATPDSRLTMYTCTPTWNPKDRLVVTATLEEPAL